MNRFEWIIYILLVILFLLYFYFIVNEKKIFEGVVDSGLSLSDETVFGQKIDLLKAANKNLENSLDKIDNTYRTLNSKKVDIVSIDMTIKDKTNESDKIADLIKNEYKLLINSVQPIMYLKMNQQNINNAAETDNIIDVKIKDILLPTSYNKFKSIAHTRITTFKGKKCLYLDGNVNAEIIFSVIPTLKQFSFSFWIYNDNTNQVDPVISIMNENDFNGKVKNSGLQVFIKNNQVEINYNTITLNSASMNTGWHHITFTTGAISACIYVDGTNVQASLYKAVPEHGLLPLPVSYETLYRLTTYFFIGKTSFIGHIYNVRYYAVEIPPKVVNDVYNLDVNTNANS